MKFVEVAGARISAIGLGTWQFGSMEWGYGREFASGEAGAIVKRALELGVNLIDTAEVYGLGRSERIVGEAIRGRRDQVFIATKVFPVGLPFMVAARARGSARRLGVDHIDLYQQHWPNPFFAASATMPRMKQLVDEGLIGHVGVSNFGLQGWQEAERALGGPVFSNQVEFSLIKRGPEADLVPWAQSQGRVVIAYSPLGKGLLSGRYQKSSPRNFRRMRREFSAESRARLEPLIGALHEVAAERGATEAQVALAWLIRKPKVVAIPGASSVRQVEENIGAVEIDLTDEEDARLSGLVSEGL